MEIIRKTMTFPKSLLDEVERYQKENMIPSFTAAMQELIRKGLKQAEKEGK